MSEDLVVQLREMMELPAETECIEFKEAKNDYGFDKIGRYFSALSNEANLHGKPAGWLIFGVTDKLTRKIVGSNYRLTPPGLDRLKEEIAQHTNHRITFVAVHKLAVDEKRVVMFEIPPAPRGVPTTWNGIAYGRSHESLEPLALYEIEEIRGQAPWDDWSAMLCEGATSADLDPEAIAFAREKYKNIRIVQKRSTSGMTLLSLRRREYVVRVGLRIRQSFSLERVRQRPSSHPQLRILPGFLETRTRSK